MAKPNVKGGIVEFAKPGETLTMTAGADLLGGNLVKLTGNRTVIAATVGDVAIGIALYDADEDDVVTIATAGVWPVIAGDGGLGFGDAVVPGSDATATFDGQGITGGSSDVACGIALESAIEGAPCRVMLTISPAGVA